MLNLVHEVPFCFLFFEKQVLKLFVSIAETKRVKGDGQHGIWLWVEDNLWKVKILGLQENIVLNDDEEDVRNDRTVLIIITFHILKEWKDKFSVICFFYL